jgi:hypothetical protein
VGRCPTLLDVFFVTDCNNSSASFKVISPKGSFGLLQPLLQYIFIYKFGLG